MNGKKTPTRKVGAGALAGAVTIVAVWGAGLAGVDVPGEVGAAVTTILTFVTSWFVTD